MEKEGKSNILKSVAAGIIGGIFISLIFLLSTNFVSNQKVAGIQEQITEIFTTIDSNKAKHTETEEELSTRINNSVRILDRLADAGKTDDTGASNVTNESFTTNQNLTNKNYITNNNSTIIQNLTEVEIDGDTLEITELGLKVADSYDDDFLDILTILGGDVSGTYDNLVVADDSHSHSSATLPAGLSLLGNTIEGSEITNGTITDDDISESAAIDWSKIDKTGADLSDFSGLLLHSDLSNLSNDDHTIYAYLTGRAGGQTVVGGTASGDDLILDSTANGSKGFIVLNPNGGKVGIGLSNPTALLHLQGLLDEVQLKVTSDDNQTNDILQILKSDGTSKLVFINANGTLRFDNEATVFEDLRVPGLLVKSGSVAPDQVDFNGNTLIKINGFNGASTTPVEDVIFNVQLPHAWKVGSTIYPHVHWTPTNANAGNVVWKLDYAWASINQAYPAFSTIATSPTATGGVAWSHKIVSLPSITGTGQGISSVLVCRLYRDPGDAGDTYNSDAGLLDIDFHIEVDSMGSDEEYVK